MMKTGKWIMNGFVIVTVAMTLPRGGAAQGDVRDAMPAIAQMDPPEQDFFSKRLDFHGIPIKAHAEVSDEALREAYQRLELMLGRQPGVRDNLVKAGAALHLIGKDQVTSDLPEHRHLKGRKLDHYGGLTVDQRTRGLGGLLASCGEENLLRLENDRYRGRDICVHEFAHNIRNNGMSRTVRGLFDDRYRAATAEGLWNGVYAATNADEFFAELSMWYFGTHGDRGRGTDIPASGPANFKAYDPASFALFDSFYTGRMRGDSAVIEE